MVLEDEDLCVSIGFTETNILSCSFDKDYEKVSYDLCECQLIILKKKKKSIIPCVIKWKFQMLLLPCFHHSGC